MKIVILNKSDSTGGAAVVSRRLLEALQAEGEDVRMLVCEKLTDNAAVQLAASPKTIKSKFLLERLKIFIALRFNKKNLFKIDTGEVGLPLWRHPAVKEADAILINWVNQGMLSLVGFEKILRLGKPVIWTMHDMWCMTGICHHAGKCENYSLRCGFCPFLGTGKEKDMSYKIWCEKNRIYVKPELMKKTAFVAVSHWVKEKCEISSLFASQRVEVISNPYQKIEMGEKPLNVDKIRILFGAARIDDPVKGLDTLKLAMEIISKEYPDIARKLELALLGNVKFPGVLEGFKIPIVKLGTVTGEESLAKEYHKSHIVVSASSYETFGCTLAEAQAYGCIPVSFNQGGQTDIIDNEETGFLAYYDDSLRVRARNLSESIRKAVEVVENKDIYKTFILRMNNNVEERFSYPRIARKYLSLITELL